MGTWLRVREQIHSNYLGQHIDDGSVDVMRRRTHRHPLTPAPFGFAKALMRWCGVSVS
jgi:hypothetical protein